MSTAAYVLANKATVRDAAKVFGVSKSTVHKDMCERLFRVNRSPAPAGSAGVFGRKQGAEAISGGGLATHRKY